MTPHEALRRFAPEHHGLVPVAEWYAAGGTRSGLRRLLEGGDWVRYTRRLLRARAAPVTDLQQAAAAVLDVAPPAALGQDSGAALWGVPGFDLLPARVTCRQQTHGRRALVLGIGHWVACLGPDLTTVYDSIPVVTPSYLVLQLFGAPWIHPMRARRAASTMLSRGLVTKRSLERVLDLTAERGRNGTRAFREFILTDAAASKVGQTGLERRFDSILERGGEPPMRVQVDLGGTEWIGRTDKVDPELPFVVELDSDLFHGALIDQEADARRTDELEAAGFTVKRFTGDDVWHRPDYVLAEVHRIRTELRRQRAA
jgi:hypothetical protein